jgi:UDP-2-acetamido-3-amino-2,3-dideoxy-glucuronate N-acetyltransferase
MAVFDDTAVDKLVLYPHRVEWKNRIPTAVKAQGAPVPLEPAEPLKLECAHFLDCVRTRATPLTDGQEGLRVLTVLDACQRSLTENGRTIQSPFSSADYADFADEDRVQETWDGRTPPVSGRRSPVRTSLSVSSAISADRSVFFAHPSAFIDPGADIGPGTKIWHFAHVLKGAKIGERCILGQNVNVDGGAVIGDNVKIQNNVSIYTGAVIEDDVFLGPSCVLTNVSNPRSQIIRHSLYEPTLLKRGCSIGANATIVCGTTIGRYAFVAAGSVVTRDVPDYALVMGNPARPKGWISRHGHRLQSPDAQGIMTCPESGLHYKEVSPGTLKCLDLDEESPLPPELAQGAKPYRHFKPPTNTDERR